MNFSGNKPKELANERFGKLIAIEPTKDRESQSIIWKCQCDCGNICYISARSLVQHKTRSCGCLKSENLIGKTFGDWTVLSLDGIRDNFNKYWLCRCSCGNESIVRGASLLGERSKKCGTCAKIQNGKNNRMDDFHVAATVLLGSYRSNAKRRELDFDLSREEFESIIKQDCYYCGIRPNNVFTSFQRKNEHKHPPIMYNGIDRIDNSKGYRLENCVPCCAQCNYAKSNLSTEQFLSWIRNIYIKQMSGISEKTFGVLTDELATVTIKCFYEQEKIRNPKLTVDEQNLAAHKAQEFNAKRNDLIRAMDKMLGQIENSPTEKTYNKE